MRVQKECSVGVKKNLDIWKIKNEKGQENGELETIQRGNQSHSETARI